MIKYLGYKNSYFDVVFIVFSVLLKIPSLWLAQFLKSSPLSIRENYDHVQKVMAIPVVEFSREGYKIRKVFG